LDRMAADDELARHYRVPTAARLAGRAAYLVAALALILVLAESAAVVFVVICAVASAYCVVLGELTIRRGGVYETATGIATRTSLGSHHETWHGIECFRAVKSRVFVIRQDGTARALRGVAQGYRIAWDGGETRDIVSVLNERLRLWRESNDAR
jgi:hypothetical protein